MKELTLLEQMILAAIISLGDGAYGVSIRKKVEKMTGRQLMYGTLYNALDQLLRKYYLSDKKGTTSSARGGRPRIYYTLTPAGREALRISYDLQQAIWKSIPGFREIENNGKNKTPSTLVGKKAPFFYKTWKSCTLFGDFEMSSIDEFTSSHYFAGNFYSIFIF